MELQWRLSELLTEEGTYSLNEVLPKGWGFARLATRSGRICVVINGSDWIWISLQRIEYVLTAIGIASV